MRENEEDKKTPTLEELLRLKKEERPGADFWRQFDRDLEKKIVQSVVHRDSWTQAFLQWIYLRGRPLTAGLCFIAVGYFFRSSQQNLPNEVMLVSEVRPAVAATEALDKVNSWTAAAAPQINGTNQDYVIEVLSSGAGSSSGAGRTWMGTMSENGDASAYYVADQLSSSDLGWSGERLPF